ncbi:hypothetical protein E4T56_gene10521 [Termitomyces sp. T112]|nr:hypothetical protein E4T56_gene10521 [Termitomyces sp. T112]
MTRITQYYNNAFTLDNDLRFQAWLLIAQLPSLTSIMLRLPWLQDINPDIDWKNLTMQFSGPKASLAAAIPLHLQSILDCNTPNPNSSTSRATQSPSTLNGSQENEDDMPLPWPSLSKSQWLPPNISQNQYKDPAAATPLPTPVDPRDLDIKIIGTIPFACILQDGTPAFQLQIMPALPEGYLYAETILLEHKTEEQILYEVVLLEYHEFADIFSEGSAKELPPHCSYNHKIDLKEGTSHFHLAKSTTCPRSNSEP